MTEVYFAIPGDIDTPTGGYGYDRRLMAELPSFGVTVRHIMLAASFPAPSEKDCANVAEQLGRLPGMQRCWWTGLPTGYCQRIS